MPARKRMAILVGGGPAPGINAVIGAATIRAVLEGVEVLGVEDGFEWLMRGDADHARPLTIPGVSRIHFRGGSHIGTSRANPTKRAARGSHVSSHSASLARRSRREMLTARSEVRLFRSSR